ncbi:glycosyltransferase [Rubrivivax gelatinosus]|uniref:Glycosyl transferase family 2 n=1 Tax=Rubrivivax gelatinosus (strain NBRC 100245 / IL144) TaxID=983917 RepID=I0HWT5_RUBGI|nr:glycosyltransferase [Rubrivivax gelatinosus]BAL97472.1 glycosyl transferase family 2 [Rubrivivax gelatinosus IL144]
MAKLTIGIVTYNAAQVLECALLSIIQKKSTAVELIVVDGASTDGTVEIIRRYANSIDHWVSEPDLGIYDAMNKVCALATGDWLLFIGADDELAASPENILQHLTEANSIYYGNVQIQRTGRVQGGRFTRYRLMQENICHQGLMYPRSVYKNCAYKIDAGMMADHLYNIERWGQGFRFRHLNLTICRFNDAGRSSIPDASLEARKLVAIRDSFGLAWYFLKRARSTAANLLKHRNAAT